MKCLKKFCTCFLACMFLESSSGAMSHRTAVLGANAVFHRGYCFDMLEATMCSSTLHRTHASDMGR